MFIKPYTKSTHLEAMEMLLKRLSLDHPKHLTVTNQIGTTRAGDIGEEIVYRELENMHLPFKFYAFHKLLLHGEKAFELDFLLITPFGAIILEVKNMIGILEFTENPSQLIQRKETGDINKIPCPAVQLNDYKYQLSQFFIDHNIPIQIFGAVVFASRKSFVKTSTTKAQILYRNEVRPFLRKFQKLPYTVTEQDMEKIKKVLLLSNTPFTYFPLSKHFSIQPEDIIRGVECTRCGYLGMQKRNRTWYCPSCRKNDYFAYKNTVTSYFLLCKDTITNKECREFLLLSNRHEAKRILANSNLTKTGSHKSSVYKLIE